MADRLVEPVEEELYPGPPIQLLQEAFGADHERCNRQLRHVIRLAHDLATKRNHESITPEHVLLVMLTQESGPFREALELLHADPGRMHAQLKGVLRFVIKPARRGAKTLTPDLKRVFEHALEEARDLKHNYIGAEHVLLGLLREPGTTAEWS